MVKNNSKTNPEIQVTTVRYRADERTNSFVKVSTDLLNRGKYLTPAAKWLYVALRSFKNVKDGRTFPSYKKIMGRSGLSRNAVAKGLAELERWGWIVRQKTEGGNNYYKFYYPSLVQTNTNEEVGDQTFPTKKMVLEWSKERSEVRNQKKLANEKKKGTKTKKGKEIELNKSGFK